MPMIHRTMIVADAHVELARHLAESLAGPSGAGMWTTPLSETGAAPATHWISAGLIEAEFAALLNYADALIGALVQAGVYHDAREVRSMVLNADVSDEDPHAAMARLGLRMVQPEGAA